MPVLEGRRAVVTGASRGIGRAVAERIAEAGAGLVVTARSAGPLAEVAATTGATPVPADLADAAEVFRLGATAHEALGGPVDIVVNAAGAFALEALHRTRIDEFDAMLTVNLRGPFLLIRAFLPVMLEHRAGDIVSVGSVAGRRALARNGAYAAAKFGLRGLHAVLDAELRGTGVRATLVEPGATDTELWDAIDPVANPGLPERAAMMRPAAVAEAVLFALTRPPEVALTNLLLERA